MQIAHLTSAEWWPADQASGDLAIRAEFRFGGDQVLDTECLGNRPGDKAISGSDDDE